MSKNCVCHLRVLALMLLLGTAVPNLPAQATRRRLPDHVPPKRARDKPKTGGQRAAAGVLGFVAFIPPVAVEAPSSPKPILSGTPGK